MIIHYIDFTVAILGGIFFLILSFSNVGKQQDHWLRTAAYLTGIFIILWGISGLLPLIFQGTLSKRAIDLFQHTRTLLGGGSLSLLIFLFISRGIFRFRKKAEQDAAANP